MAQNAQVGMLTPKWRQVEVQTPVPRPRHGHRAVAIRDMMIVFGGGSEGIVDSLHVFRSTSNQWSCPTVKGEIPPGCAAFGFCTDGINRVFLCGGMLEFGKYSNDIYELKISTWEWKKITARKPKNVEMPKPRLGHSFSMIGTKLYLFGGLANASENPRENYPVYLNDLYTIEIKSTSATQQWECPVTYGQPPSPRESHSATAYSTTTGNTRLLIYGGMNGNRLGDFFILDIGSMTWSQPVINGIPPLARSLHSASVINRKLYIFGGWVPSETKNEYRNFWKCSNALSIFNLDTLTWEHSTKETLDKQIPQARAGHVGTAIGSRMYLWSGRDGFRKLHQSQFCYSDLWFLETELPHPPQNCQLKRANASALDMSWSPVVNAEKYIVQIMKIPDPPVNDSLTTPSTNINPTPTSGVPFSAINSTPNPPFISDPNPYAAAKKRCLPDTPTIVPQITMEVTPSSSAILSPQPITIHPVSSPNVTSQLPITQNISGTISPAIVRQPIVSQIPTSTISPIIQSVSVQGPSLAGMQALAAAAEQTGRLNTTKVVHVQHAPLPHIQHHVSSPQPIQHTVSTTPTTVRMISPQAITSMVRPSGSNIISVGTSHPGTTPISIQTPIRFISSTHSIGSIGAKPVVLKATTTAGHKMSGTIKTGPLIKVIKQGDFISNDSTLLTNRQANVGKLVTTNPSGVKMLVLPSSSTSTPTNAQIVQGTKARTINPKMIQLPKTLNIRQLTPGSSIRLLQTNGSNVAQPRLIFQMQTSNPITTTRPSIPIITTAAAAVSSLPPSIQPPRPSLSTTAAATKTDADLLIDNQTARPEEISTVIPQVDGAENDIELSEDNKSSQPDCNKTQPIGIQPNTVEMSGDNKPEVVSLKTEKPIEQKSESTSEPKLELTPEATLRNDTNLDVKPPSPKKAPPHIIGKWFDVDITHSSKCNIIGFYVPLEENDPDRMFDVTCLPTFDERNKFQLDPATHYKIRIAGINQLGRGPWSEELIFQTYIPGYPTAPAQIRISKQDTGACLTWASGKSEDVTEYTVLIAVGVNATEGMVFERIYSGSKPQCFVPFKELQEACLYGADEKPVVIFRVSARNSMGVGPQTQVKWLMDSSLGATQPATDSAGKIALAKKRSLPNE